MSNTLGVTSRPQTTHDGTELSPHRSPRPGDTRSGGAVVDTSLSPHALLRPLSLRDVHVAEGFWHTKQQLVRREALFQQYEQCERTGRIDNFRRAAGKIQGPFRGKFYDDSDVYKWLEAACFALAGGHDPDLAALVDRVIAEIAAAQSPDGYLNTYFAFEHEPERWTNLSQMHELYCAGHLIQAAVAHRRATNSDTLLHVAIRLADHICRRFGPDGHPGTCGHEEIEMALVELYRETGNATYLTQAQLFLDRRGTPESLLNGVVRFQDHLPVRRQADIAGHAVRAVYLAAGIVDVALETGEDALLAAARRLWQSAFERKAYVTGGLGARWEHEAFGDDFDLPNERAYAETCAAIGGLFWNWRMLLLTGEARYADWMETALYNGILSGISLDGQHYFYQNLLADRGMHRRTPWFETACCPPNIARLLLSLQGYLYTTSPASSATSSATISAASDTSSPGDANRPDSLWIHHFVPGSVRASLPGGNLLALRVETRYPWDGQIRITVEEAPTESCGLALRIPGWCTRAHLSIHGQSSAEAGTIPTPTPVPGTYANVQRVWRPGDVVTLNLDMPPRRIAGDDRVAATRGRTALARGPIVYCVEQADNPGYDVWRWTLAEAAPLSAEEAPDLLGGIVTLHGPMPRAPHKQFTAIPYHTWANRDPGPMSVWLLTAEASERV